MMCDKCGANRVTRVVIKRKSSGVSEVRFCNRCYQIMINRKPKLYVQGFRRMPPKPTNALPGTPAKLAVLEYRAANNYELWHPDDAKAPLT